MVRKAVFILSNAIFLLLLGSAAGAAQMACEDRDKITKALKKDYAEMPVSAGLDNAGRMIEVFASTKGSWTILVTTPSGISCLLATGKNWLHRDIKKIKGKDVPL